MELSDIMVGKDVIVVKTTMPSGSTVSGDFVTKEFRFENVPSDAVVDSNNWSFMETTDDSWRVTYSGASSSKIKAGQA